MIPQGLSPTIHLSTAYIDTMADRDILEGVSWQRSYQGKPSYAAYSETEVLMISQDEGLQIADAVPRQICELSDDDKKQLERLNIPASCWNDDATIMAARYALDKIYTVVKVERSKPQNKLNKSKVLQLIRDAMKTSSKPKSELKNRCADNHNS